MRFSLRPAALAGAFVLLLCSCAPAPTPSAAPTPVPTAEVSASVPTEAPTVLGEPPLLDWMEVQPVPDFLEKEQQELFLRAFSAANFLMGCSTGNVDYYPLADSSAPDSDLLNSAEYIEFPGAPEGWRYRTAVGRYARWEDFKAMLDSLFTPEYLDQLLNFTADGVSHPIFTSTGDGRLCYLEMDRGSYLEYDWCATPDSYELVSQTEEEILFDLIGHYAQLGHDPEADMPVVEGEYTQSYPIRMVNTADGWRFSEFHLPY